MGGGWPEIEGALLPDEVPAEVDGDLLVPPRLGGKSDPLLPHAVRIIEAATSARERVIGAA